MNKQSEKYIPALGYDFLTPLYDPVVKLTVREKAFKAELIRQIALHSENNSLQPAHFLDLGCGTGTLTAALKNFFPEAEIFGLDGDPKVLEIAAKKIERLNLKVKFDEGLSNSLPYPDDYFDGVVSSLFFHHLSTGSKHQTLAEIFRVLKPGSRLYLADWGKPENLLMKILSFQIKWLDGATALDNFEGKLSDFATQAGFTEVTETDFYNTLFGTIRIQTVRKNS